jgi:hypothetical protein
MTARRLIRFAAPALFVGATVALPALHQAFHGRDHDHVGGGIRFHRHDMPAPPRGDAPHSQRHDAAHRHGDGPWHSHEAPAAPADTSESDPRHGEGSLAHFSCALGEGSPLPVAEISAPLESAPAVRFPRDPEAAPGFFRPATERGPPLSSLV